MKRNDQLHKRRQPEDYFNLGRTQLENHLRTERAKVRKDNVIYQFGDLLIKSMYKWIYFYLRSRFGRKHPFQGYQHPETGIYDISGQALQNEEITIAVAGDWATNTDDAFAIMNKIAELEPDYTIHIGDTYFVGAPHEIQASYLLEDSPWVRGRKGSFALLGNHEMYGRGVSFYRDLLPSLGIKDQEGNFGGQKAAYFSLETPFWRIIALDTGYHSVSIPIIERLQGHTPRTHLPDSLVEWLRTTAGLGDPTDRRGLLFLSHHQYLSAFSDLAFPIPGEQLATMIGTERPVIWLWGHEHKMAVYDKAKIGDGVTAYGRCIGHGGMPVAINGDFNEDTSNAGFPYLLLTDKRVKKTYDDQSFGYNGFSMIRLKDKTLTIEYYDHETMLLSEDWMINDDLELSRSVSFQSDLLS